jgi:hypothetical protein
MLVRVFVQAFLDAEESSARTNNRALTSTRNQAGCGSLCPARRQPLVLLLAIPWPSDSRGPVPGRIRLDKRHHV